jgi:hypothetical protein
MFLPDSSSWLPWARAVQGTALSTIFTYISAMRTNAIFLLFFLPVVAGCSKTGQNPGYFRFQLGGVTYSFDSVVVWVDTPNAHIVTIDGLNTGTGSSFHVESQSNAGSLNGTYSYLNPPPSDKFLVAFDFAIRSGQTAMVYVVEGAPFTFTIGSSTGTTISGSFSGSIAVLSSGRDTTVTNGQFDLPYKFR